MNYSSIEREIGYTFKDKKLLKTALTHTSYAHMHRIESNEKLEYLGDSILEFIISKYLYVKYTKLNEGEMTKLRASVVCESSLYEVALKLNIGSFLITSKGEGFGHVTNKAILADAIEAIIAGIFLDSNLEEAERFIIENLKDSVEIASKNVGTKDYKTVLQEKLQVNGNVKIEYKIVLDEGPDHDKHFVSQVLCDGYVLATGEGRSKKASEMEAAKKALENMKN